MKLSNITFDFDRLKKHRRQCVEECHGDKYILCGNHNYCPKKCILEFDKLIKLCRKIHENS